MHSLEHRLYRAAGGGNNDMTGAETEFDVKWVKHRLTDRFFADPFILSVEGGVIKVL